MEYVENVKRENTLMDKLHLVQPALMMILTVSLVSILLTLLTVKAYLGLKFTSRFSYMIFIS